MTVYRLGVGDDPLPLVAPIVLAFARDPFVRWLLPHPTQFVESFSAITRSHAQRTAAAGGAFLLDDGRGAATWYPPGEAPDGGVMRSVMEQAGAAERAGQVWPHVEPHEPEEPHWYLRQIGVDPALQGQGVGGALLAAGLEVVDAEGGVAYLEATSSSSRRLYERHGFAVLAEVSIDGSPPLWPMLRARR